MIDWQSVQQTYNDLLERLNESSLDRKERADLQRKVSRYADLLRLHQEQQGAQTQVDELNELLKDEQDAEMRELYATEQAALSERLTHIERELEDKLYPADEHDERSVYLEIRAGAGGQEAALFATDLYSMYRIFADKYHWQVSVVDQSLTDIGGCKELVLHIKGRNVYKKLKFESGVHRVQRVPATETQGRVHTSTVTVAVLPEAEEVDVAINPNDLRIDTYRAGGAGGQHVNKTDSAVRITHMPTGIVVQCQDERSQIKNKNKAMKVLRSRILEVEKNKQAAEQSSSRKQQIGTGERSEKIRTYNYPQNRLTDHRINLTLKKLDIIMQGEFDEVVDALLDVERKQRRELGVSL